MESVSKTLMVWVLRWISLRCDEPCCLFISRILKKIFLCLNLRFDVISHFLPNLFVTGIILDYLHLVSENPRAPSIFRKKKKNVWEVTYPHLKPLYSQSFLQSTSMTLIIINPLHSRVAHSSFDIL